MPKIRCIYCETSFVTVQAAKKHETTCPLKQLSWVFNSDPEQFTKEVEKRKENFQKENSERKEKEKSKQKYRKKQSKEEKTLALELLQLKHAPPKEKRIGVYTVSERKAVLERYHAKRKRRVFVKKRKRSENDYEYTISVPTASSSIIKINGKDVTSLETLRNVVLRKKTTAGILGKRSTDSEWTEFRSVTEAGSVLSKQEGKVFSLRNIVNVCRGRFKHHHGSQFKYTNSNIKSKVNALRRSFKASRKPGVF